MTNICVFCGSSIGINPTYAAAARLLGADLARRGLGLVYGGGRVGLMGVLADAVLDAGGEVIGVIPEHLITKEIENRRIPDLRVVKTMHERKALMADLAHGFIALPGGFGTYDEFCEIVTWAQLGLHRKPCAILNIAGYYDALLAMFDHATAEGFIRPAHRAMLIISTDPADLLDRIARYHPPAVEKWINRSDI